MAQVLSRRSRVTRSRSSFCRILAIHGVIGSQAGVESPEQIGRVQRHGGRWKAIWKRTASSTSIAGEAEVRLAAAEVDAIKADMSRRGGYSPRQWVLWYTPRGGYADRFDEEEFAAVGVLRAHADPQAVFAKLTEVRTAARRAFVYEDLCWTPSRIGAPQKSRAHPQGVPSWRHRELPARH